MVSFQDVQTAYYMVAATGVLVAAVFYVLNMKATLQTRQAQLFTSLQKDMNDYQGQLRARELYYMKWDSYDDFEKKYGSDNNPESYAMRISSWTWYNSLGLMLKQGLLNEDNVYDYVGTAVILTWSHWEAIIREQRVRYMGPDWMGFYEYAAGRMKLIQVKRSIRWEPPKTMIEYVPDKK